MEGQQLKERLWECSGKEVPYTEGLHFNQQNRSREAHLAASPDSTTGKEAAMSSDNTALSWVSTGMTEGQSLGAQRREVR